MIKISHEVFTKIVVFGFGRLSRHRRLQQQLRKLAAPLGLFTLAAELLQGLPQKNDVLLQHSAVKDPRIWYAGQIRLAAVILSKLQQALRRTGPRQTTFYASMPHITLYPAVQMFPC